MNIFKVLFFVISGGAALLGFELSQHTHSARWSVKTLADSFAVAAHPIPTTIDEQEALPAPTVDESVPRLSSEHTLYVLMARLIEVKKEFDGDYHLVLEDPQTKLRIVAEIPSSDSRVPLAYRRDYVLARQTIDRMVGEPGFFSVQPKSPTMIEITGLGFFDEPHMFTPNGMAPNGREIHPVLTVRPM